VPQLWHDPPGQGLQGGIEGTALTAFTDGCPGLRRFLLDAGVEELCVRHRFHVAMRLQHLMQIA
jgi:hypothetical protein